MLTTKMLGTCYTSRHVVVVPGKECQGPATWQGTRLKSAISVKQFLLLLIKAEVKYPESIIYIPQDAPHLMLFWLNNLSKWLWI